MARSTDAHKPRVSPRQNPHPSTINKSRPNPISGLYQNDDEDLITTDHLAIGYLAAASHQDPASSNIVRAPPSIICIGSSDSEDHAKENNNQEDQQRKDDDDEGEGEQHEDDDDDEQQEEDDDSDEEQHKDKNDAKGRRDQSYPVKALQKKRRRCDLQEAATDAEDENEETGRRSQCHATKQSHKRQRRSNTSVAEMYCTIDKAMEWAKLELLRVNSLLLASLVRLTCIEGTSSPSWKALREQALRQAEDVLARHSAENSLITVYQDYKEHLNSNADLASS